MPHKMLDWMPWYPGDFWSSLRVLRLSESACNLYRWMLDYQWLHGAVPDDLLLVRRLYPWGENAADSWNAVRPLFDVVDGQLVNPRLRTLYAEASVLMQRKVAGGRKSAETRKQRYGTASPQPPAEESSKSPQKTVPKTTRTPDRNGSERIGSDRNGENQKPARKLAGGDSAELTRHVEAEFLRTRKTSYVHGGVKDGSAAAALVKALGLPEAKRRATAMLEDADAFVYRKASIAYLRSEVNRWAPGARPTQRELILSQYPDVDDLPR